MQRAAAENHELGVHTYSHPNLCASTAGEVRLAALPTGSQFDIHFQVIDAVTGGRVLASGCYRFTVSL